MSTLLNPKSSSKSPCKKYLRFNAKKGEFCFNHEDGEDILPSTSETKFRFLVLDQLYCVSFTIGDYPDGVFYKSNFVRSLRGDFKTKVKVYAKGQLVFSANNEDELNAEMEKRFGKRSLKKLSRIFGILLDDKGQLTNDLISFDHKGVVSVALISYQKENKVNFMTHPVLNIEGGGQITTNSKHPETFEAPVFSQEEMEFQNYELKENESIQKLSEYISAITGSEGVGIEDIEEDFEDDLPY